MQVTLRDGREVRAPILRWGKRGCWPRGSSSDISQDFVVRGVYYPQLVALLQQYHTVGLVCAWSHTVVVLDGVRLVQWEPTLRCACRYWS